MKINFNNIPNICLYGKCTKIKTLTLKDAISYALENKADAKKAKLKVKTANTKFRKFVREAEISANGSLTQSYFTDYFSRCRIFWWRTRNYHSSYFQKWISTAFFDSKSL
jgi:outer membrane protein TolC